MTRRTGTPSCLPVRASCSRHVDAGIFHVHGGLLAAEVADCIVTASCSLDTRLIPFRIIANQRHDLTQPSSGNSDEVDAAL